MSLLPEMVDPAWLAKACEELRTNALFCGEGGDEDPVVFATPEAEQYILLAIGALEQAQRFARVAEYKLAKKE